MALKRTDAKLVRPVSGLKRPEARRPMMRRKPLANVDVPDPMDGHELTGEVMDDVKTTVTAAENAVREARERERLRMELTGDGAFYFVAVFDTRDQKMAYLKARGLDKDGDIYIDGRAMADQEGIKIPDVKVKMPGFMKPDRKLSELVGDMSDGSGKTRDAAKRRR